MSNYQQDKILERIAELKGALEESLPNLPVLLKEIHASLREDPDTVTLLEPDQIATIVRGLESYESTDVVERAVKKAKKGSRKKAAPVSADML